MHIRMQCLVEAREAELNSDSEQGEGPAEEGKAVGQSAMLK
jgi:hypothetical protein